MTHEITTVLARWGRGEPEALRALVPLVYDRLRRLAGVVLRGRRAGTLEPTLLVHETYLELLGQRRVAVADREHFFALAGYLMRRLVVARERRRRRQRRGGGLAETTLDEGLLVAAGAGIDVVAVHQALERLERVSPRQARLVEQRFFAGFALPEAAANLGISLATANRDWRLARAFLQAELEDRKP